MSTTIDEKALRDYEFACAAKDLSAAPWWQGDTEEHREGDADLVYTSREYGGTVWVTDCLLSEADAAFIAQSRTMGPLLAAAFREQAKTIAKLQKEMEGRPVGKGGRKAAKPTTPDGRLVARACKRLDLTVVALAEAIGAHESVLSRARAGELPVKHREAIKALIKGKSKRAS